MKTRLMALGTLACLCAGSLEAVADPAVDAEIVNIAAGLEFSSGTYGGAEEFKETYVPVSVSLNRGRLHARLTVPYLSLEGPLVDLADTGEAITRIGTRSGLGDVVASLTVYDVVYSERLNIAVDLTGKAKFGTADADEGLGTGENDYSVLADVYKFYDRITLITTLGYKFRGDPAGQDLDDVMLGSLGGLCDCAARSRFGLFYDYREASLTGGDEVRELTLFASRKLNHTWQIQYYVFSGFTDSGPDWGGGFQFGLNLPRPQPRDRL